MKYTVKRDKKVVAEIILKHQGAGEWEIAWLEVSESFRGQGLATMLLEKAKKFVRNKGNLLVGFLDPRAGGLTRAQMVEWHKRHGFTCGWYEFNGITSANKRAMLWSPQR